MGFKYHPDLDGSQRAMQLINTAWSISQSYQANPRQSATVPLILFKQKFKSICLNARIKDLISSKLD